MPKHQTISSLPHLKKYLPHPSAQLKYWVTLVQEWVCIQFHSYDNWGFAYLLFTHMPVFWFLPFLQMAAVPTDMTLCIYLVITLHYSWTNTCKICFYLSSKKLNWEEKKLTYNNAALYPHVHLLIQPDLNPWALRRRISMGEMSILFQKCNKLIRIEYKIKLIQVLTFCRYLKIRFWNMALRKFSTRKHTEICSQRHVGTHNSFMSLSLDHISDLLDHNKMNRKTE